jgi:hypothetical protein
LRFEDATHSVWLDGMKIAEEIDPAPYTAFKAIAKANGARVSSNELRKLPGLKGKSVKIKPKLDRLPRAVRRLVKSKPAANGGYWIELPPPKSRP